jgi:hypothetical protein
MPGLDEVIRLLVFITNRAGRPRWPEKHAPGVIVIFSESAADIVIDSTTSSLRYYALITYSADNAFSSKQ